jgi:phospholipid-binding lipoprotein MlaA
MKISIHSNRRSAFLALTFVIAALLGGCATNNPRDPLEPFNRSMFTFNEAVDKAVGQPVAKAYNAVLPPLVRQGVSNFFNNATDFVSSVNCFLQLRLQCGAENMLRFSFNTVFGLAGVLDIMTEAGLARTPTDFGITLGRYGIGSGPYLVLPLLGPSSIRDVTSTAYGIDGRLNPVSRINDTATSYGLTGLGFVNTRARLLRASDLFDEVAIDKYTFTREAYTQRRRSQVYDGNPPDEEEEADPKDVTKDSDKTAPKEPAPAAEKPVEPASAPK